MNSRLFLPVILTACLLAAICFAGDASDPPFKASTLDEIKAEFESVPCQNESRLDAVRALFERMGAKPEDIAVDVSKNKKTKNLVLRKTSSSPQGSNGKIVIGAHYDLKGKGCGAIDNWTGIISIAHIYSAIKDAEFNKEIIFVAFGREEEGLIGSSMMVDGIRKEQALEYCAMVNIDSLGLGALQAADNFSSKKLVEASAALARELSLPFAHSRLEGGNSDSSSFIRKKIPALTFHALSGDWIKILHSEKDTTDKINFESVYLGYRLALALLVKIDQSSCQAFR